MSGVILRICFIVFLFAAVGAAQAQSPSSVRGNAFALGVHMGFASFALHEADREPERDALGFEIFASRQSRERWCSRAKSEMTSAGTNVAGVNSYLASASPENRLSAPDISAAGDLTCPAEQFVVNLRGGYSATLARGPADLANAYNLGVNIGIAEIQASVGEPARQIVIASLSNARGQVSALGLNAQPLEDAFNLAISNASMTVVHERVLSARTTYQSSL